MLKLQDVKETVKAKCVAENDGGREETNFEVFVTGNDLIFIFFFKVYFDSIFICLTIFTKQIALNRRKYYYEHKFIELN